METRGKGKSSGAEKFYGKRKQTGKKTRKRTLDSKYNVSDYINEQVWLQKIYQLIYALKFRVV